MIFIFSSALISSFRSVFSWRPIRLCWVCRDIADEILSLTRQLERHQRLFMNFPHSVIPVIWWDILISFDSVYYSVLASLHRVLLHLSLWEMMLLLRRIVSYTISTAKHEIHYVFEMKVIDAIYMLVYQWVFLSQTIRNIYDSVSSMI